MQKTEVMNQLYIMPEANGEVEMLTPFWSIDVIKADLPDCVPTLLTYAELNASLDSRNRETAKRIKQKFNV